MTDTNTTRPDGDFVDATIGDPTHPVTLFSLSWCSYCRGARQLLGQLGIPYRLFELDRGEFLDPSLQRQVRARLQQLTGSSTLPQLFIGGESLGGYTETLAARGNGKLHDVLTRHAVKLQNSDQ
ncbi:MAG: glutaredoxin domain-containing protein [Pseudomonadota bacterium]